jgi:hypothetical protein
MLNSRLHYIESKIGCSSLFQIILYVLEQSKKQPILRTQLMVGRYIEDSPRLKEVLCLYL